jgi:hypothetical protein
VQQSVRRASAWPAAIALGIAVALAAALVIAVTAAGGDRTPEMGSDAALFAGVARDPFGDGSTIIAPVVNGPAYRYGRILFPLTGWALAFGRPAWVAWSLAAIFATSLGATVTLSAGLLAQRNRPGWYGLAVLATPFTVLWVDAPAVVAEPMVAALVLGVYAIAASGRDRPARGVAAAAILTRETAVLAFVPLVWRAWREDGWHGLAGWAWVPVPYLLWAGWVRLRIGDWPFTDPAYSRRAAISAPFDAIHDVLSGAFRNGEQLTLLVGLGTVVLALFVWRARPWHPVSTGALWSAAIVPFLGFNVWSYLFEASRVMYIAQTLAVLALVGGGQAVRRSEAR